MNRRPKIKTVYRYFYVNHHYKGERCFRVKFNIDDIEDIAVQVIQVCVSQGEVKRGRANTFGIYKVSWSSITSNYAYANMTKCSKKLYTKLFKQVLKRLQ